jgi:hypothetical protein
MKREIEKECGIVERIYDHRPRTSSLQHYEKKSNVLNTKENNGEHKSGLIRQSKEIDYGGVYYSDKKEKSENERKKERELFETGRTLRNRTYENEKERDSVFLPSSYEEGDQREEKRRGPLYIQINKGEEIRAEGKFYGVGKVKSEINEDEEFVNEELETEDIMIERLQAKYRELERKRMLREQDEYRIQTRIRELEVKESELDKKRRIRERLQKEIKIKEEEEKLNMSKIAEMKRKEAELLEKLNYLDWNHEDLEGEEYRNIPKMRADKDETLESEREMKKDYGRESYRRKDREINKDHGRELYNFGKPKIPAFDGTDFKVWKIEVECIIKSEMYPEYLVAQAIRNSLQGQTRKVLLTINPMAKSTELLKKLEDIYGNTQTEDTIMQDFFNAVQHESETTSDWGLRLESIMQMAIETGEIPETKKNSFMKHRFWKGLNNETLRNNTRVTFESSATFEDLRKKARQEEEELKRVGRGYVPRLCEKEENSEGLERKEKKFDTSEEQLNILKNIVKKMEDMQRQITEIRKVKSEAEGEKDNSQKQNRDDGNWNRGYRNRSYRDNFDKSSHKYSPEKKRDDRKDTETGQKEMKKEGEGKGKTESTNTSTNKSSTLNK